MFFFEHKQDAIEENPQRNPFIHGTNSSVLPILNRSDQRLMSPIKLLKEYGLPCLTGELFLGGLNGVDNELPPCFGRVKLAHYSLATIQQQYATTENNIGLRYSELANKRFVIEEKSYIDSHQAKLWHRINQELIVFARRKLFGASVEFPESFKGGVQQSIYLCRQYFYLYLFIGKYIVLNRELYQSLTEEKKQDLDSYLQNIVKQQDILHKIKECAVDLKSLWESEHPKHDDLQKVLEILPNPDFFVIRDNAYQPQIAVNERGRFQKAITEDEFTRYISEGSHRFGLGMNLSLYVNGGYDDAFSMGLTELIPKHVAALEGRAELFLAILEKDYSRLHFSEQEISLMQSPFPLIFISTDVSVMRELNNFSRSEYRAVRSLKLGEDITSIATPEPYQERLKHYLKQMGLASVKVISYNDLEKMDQNCQTSTVLKN